MAEGVEWPAVVCRARAARQLAYVFYTACERKGMADDARCYNEPVVAWNDIPQASYEQTPPAKLKQEEFGL